MASIYGLYDCKGRLRYIGKANNPDERLARHMRDSRRRRTPLYDWIRKHGRPEMRVLISDSADWAADERRLIAVARGDGALLLNVADGGDQPKASMETNRRNGAALNARLRADPVLMRLRLVKAELGRALRRGYASNKARAKMRLAAAKSPRLFGEWARIEDREENPDGSPVGGYGHRQKQAA